MIGWDLLSTTSDSHAMASGVHRGLMRDNVYRKVLIKSTDQRMHIVLPHDPPQLQSSFEILLTGRQLKLVVLEQELYRQSRGLFTGKAVRKHTVNEDTSPNDAIRKCMKRLATCSKKRVALLGKDIIWRSGREVVALVVPRYMRNLLHSR
jgi:hypothetical protein